jgi:hypothetical protein
VPHSLPPLLQAPDMAELQAQLAALEPSVQQFEALEADLEQAQHKVSRLPELQQQRDRIQEQLEEAEGLQQQLAALRQTMQDQQELQHALRQEQAKLWQVEGRVEALQQELEPLRVKAALVEPLTQQVSELKEATAQVDKLEAVVDKLRKEAAPLVELQQKQRDLTADLAAMAATRAMIQVLQAQVQPLGQLQAQQRELEQQQAALQEEAAQFKQLHAQCEELQQQVKQVGCAAASIACHGLATSCRHRCRSRHIPWCSHQWQQLAAVVVAFMLPVVLCRGLCLAQADPSCPLCCCRSQPCRSASGLCQARLTLCPTSRQRWLTWRCWHSRQHRHGTTWWLSGPRLMRRRRCRQRWSSCAARWGLHSACVWSCLCAGLSPVLYS